MTPGEAAEHEAEERVARMQAIPDLKPITRQISTLKMNNQPVKVLYETVGKLAGINVVIDPEFQAGAKANYTIDLSNTTLEEALDNLGRHHQDVLEAPVCEHHLRHQRQRHQAPRL